MSKAPSTNATRTLKQAGVPFTEHLYRYEDHGGTQVSARELGVEEHVVIKTLVMEDASCAAPPIENGRHAKRAGR